MLQPPGSSRSGGNKSFASSRRKTQENPTDQLRKLTKLPPNKKCADCQSKLPQCVNMTVGSFVCMTCAGIHRELNNKVKSLGHATFTPDEVQMMQQTDNDKVNALWLARYDPSRDRMKPPNGNQDQNHLRAWIRTKYQDKQWYGGDGPTSGESGPAPNEHQHQKEQRVARGPPPQPTIVQMPPTEAPAPAPQLDLFASFDDQSPPAKNANDDDWAGFGGSSQQQQNFAKFGEPIVNSNLQHSDPFATAPTPLPPHDFTSFVSNTTMPATPAVSVATDPFAATHPPLAAMSTAQQNFANFGNGVPQQFPQQPEFSQPQPQPLAQGGFSNYSNTQQQTLPQSSQTSHAASQLGFGGYNDSNISQTPSVAPTQQPYHNTHIQPAHQIHQTGFANFNNVPPPANAQFTPQQPPTGFTNFHQFSQHPQLQSQLQVPPMQLPPTGIMAVGIHPVQGMSATMADPGLSVPIHENQVPPTLEPSSMQPPIGPMSSRDTNIEPNPKEDPMDAFAHLTVGGVPNNKEMPPAAAANGSPNQNTTLPKYSEDQFVRYKSNGNTFAKAKVVKVHHDGEPQPYYTIALPFGKEKQTDDAHLEPLDAAVEEIERKLLILTPAQLQQLGNFLSTIVKDTDEAPVGASTGISEQTQQTQPPALGNPFDLY